MRRWVDMCVLCVGCVVNFSEIYGVAVSNIGKIGL
jgi:hypothetical protein